MVQTVDTFSVNKICILLQHMLSIKKKKIPKHAHCVICFCLKGFVQNAAKCLGQIIQNKNKFVEKLDQIHKPSKYNKWKPTIEYDIFMCRYKRLYLFNILLNTLKNIFWKWQTCTSQPDAHNYHYWF